MIASIHSMTVVSFAVEMALSAAGVAIGLSVRYGSSIPQLPPSSMLGQPQ
jgi:hypothetical protein